MKSFNDYLESSGEIGFVDEARNSLVYVSGIPKVRAGEVVIFENQELGQVFSIAKEFVEVLLLTGARVNVGSKVTRTGALLKVNVGEGLLGRMIDPLGNPIDQKGEIRNTASYFVDRNPPKIFDKQQIKDSLETGVTLVDLVVPLGKGQRELVIGDRKTGKTEFLLDTIVNQAQLGSVCIYAVIGQKKADIKKLTEFFQQKGVSSKIVIVATSSSDPSGLIHLTPYTAMTAAEAFVEKGKEVLLILDDMTTHARCYREISLLAKRFPGKSSYPGDIFYVHARLIERAGKFSKGAITCLPVAESLLGDISGYIQTNLMAMTDGHIFFDINLYNQGKRPAVNPFLSVTRVGHQTQTPLKQDLSRNLLSFLISYEQMKQFLHFGAEVGETTRNILKQGAIIDSYFQEESHSPIPANANILIAAGIWAGIWSEAKIEEFRAQSERVVLDYKTNSNFRKEADELISLNTNFSDLVGNVRKNPEIIIQRLK